MTIIFRIEAQKYQNKAFLAPNKGFSILRETLCLDKFDGADLKYDNIFLKIKLKNTLDPKFIDFHS